MLLKQVLLLLLISASAEALEIPARVNLFSLYNRDDHYFSRARILAELGLKEDLKENWYFESLVRGEIDPAVWKRDDYRREVRRDEKYKVSARTFYLEYHELPWRIRMGLQEVVWGEALHYFSADLLHPKDYRDFFLNSLAYSRVPQSGLYIAREDESTSFQFVYFPYTEVNHYPRFGSEFYLREYGVVDLGLGTPPVKKAYDFKKPTVGVNFGKHFGALELHLMAVMGKDYQYYYSRSRNRFEFDRLFSAALTASYTYEALLFRFEAIQYSNRSLNRIDLSSSDLIVKDRIPETNALAAIEWNVNEDLTLSTQAFTLQRYGCKDGQILACRGYQQAFGIRKTRLPFNFELDSTAWIEFKDPSVWWSTKIKRAFGEHTSVTLGAEEFFGSGSTIYSQLARRDQVRGEIEIKW